MSTTSTIPRLTWEPMNVGGTGQGAGDIWHLHAYAHPATRYKRASWSVYRHTVKIAHGRATSFAAARHCAEIILASASA
jgi:hypothetical protein